MLRVVICLCLAVCLYAAPAEVAKAKEASKLTVKRSVETIQYQPNNNKPLTTGKKSMGTDGVAPPDVNQMVPDKLDKKATMTAERASIPAKPEVTNVEENKDDSSTKTDDEIKDLTHMVLNSEYSKENPESALSLGPAAPEEMMMPIASDPSQELPPSTDPRKEEEQKKNVGALSFHEYFYPLFANNQRKKRTASAYTAEGMAAAQTDHSAELQHRAKRGIRFTPDDMETLENYLRYNGDYINGERGSINLPDDAFDNYYSFGKRSGDSADSSRSVDSSAQREAEEKEIKDELELMRYLTADSGSRSEEDRSDIKDYDTSLSEDMDAKNAGIEAIVYHGRPGIFIPVDKEDDVNRTPQKRQYMSFVSGAKRNQNPFYPYAYEPASSSKWGALVPGEKRSVGDDDYQRLYKLASALGTQGLAPESQEWIDEY